MPHSKSRAFRRTGGGLQPPKTVSKRQSFHSDDDWVSTESASGAATPVESEDSSPHVQRPPSSLSTKSLRLHPLIRAPSSTTIQAPLPTCVPRPQPLEPLTVTDVDVAFPAAPSYQRPRPRTLSTASSLALSSLAHFPSATSPPSPAPLTPSSSSHSHLISFFPPTNPHANIELIHPLLPHPYLGNHLTVLAKRVPMRDALERVTLDRAKWESA